MKVSDWAVKVCANFEGFRAKPYYCPAGVLTQGFGHTRAAGGAIIGRPPVWSRAFAERVLREDMDNVGKAILVMLDGRSIKQHEFDAFVCLAFNIGLSAFGKSTALRRFMSGRPAAMVVEAMKWWNKAKVNGQRQTLQGLVRRRNAEGLMFLGVKDLDFDGDRDPGEPVYGGMPQGEITEELPLAHALPAPDADQPVKPVKPVEASGGWTETLFWIALAAVIGTTVIALLFTN